MAVFYGFSSSKRSSSFYQSALNPVCDFKWFNCGKSNLRKIALMKESTWDLALEYRNYWLLLHSILVEALDSNKMKINSSESEKSNQSDSF